MSVTVNNGPIQDYDHPDNYVQPTFEMTYGFIFLYILPLTFLKNYCFVLDLFVSTENVNIDLTGAIQMFTNTGL